MAHNILGIIFHIDAQDWRDGQLSIPIEYCRLLDVEAGDEVFLLIRAYNGHRTFYSGKETLKSGNEVYSEGLREAVKAGESVIIEVSKA